MNSLQKTKTGVSLSYVFLFLTFHSLAQSHIQSNMHLRMVWRIGTFTESLRRSCSIISVHIQLNTHLNGAATTHAALIKRQNIYFMAALKLTMVNMENRPQMLHQHSTFDARSEPVDCYSCCENCAHNMLIKECTCIICSSAETRKCFNRWW